MNNKTILITGVSKGLGLCTTRLLLEKGTHAIVLSRSEGELGELLATYPSTCIG